MEDISSPEVAAVTRVVVLADLVDPVDHDFLVVRRMDVAPDIYPSDRISSFRWGHTVADGAYLTDPDSGSLA